MATTTNRSSAPVYPTTKEFPVTTEETIAQLSAALEQLKAQTTTPVVETPKVEAPKTTVPPPAGDVALSLLRELRTQYGARKALAFVLDGKPLA